MRQSIVGLATFLITAACHSDRTQGPPAEPPEGALTIVVDHVSGTSTGDTLVIGDYASFSLMGADSVVPKDPIEWTLTDTTVVGIDYQIAWAIGLQARRPGRATLTVKYQGETGTHNLVVRDVRASDSAVAVVQPGYGDSIIANVGDTALVGFGVYDARGNQVWGRPYTISLSDSTVLQEISSPYEHVVAYRALKAGSSVVTLTCEGVHGSTKVVVH
jgi:hypothetical protein